MAVAEADPCSIALSSFLGLYFNHTGLTPTLVILPIGKQNIPYSRDQAGLMAFGLVWRTAAPEHRSKNKRDDPPSVRDTTLHPIVRVSDAKNRSQ